MIISFGTGREGPALSQRQTGAGETAVLQPVSTLCILIKPLLLKAEEH